MENYIEFKHICKSFFGQVALDDVSFEIKKGEIHALVGENGAGKTTLLNILNGLFSPNSGEILIDGKAVHFDLPEDALKAGIAKVHQEINLVPELSVMQNIMLGDELTKGLFLDTKQMLAETTELLSSLKCKFSPDDKVATLNVGEKQMLQIAKALRSNSKIISFDEPTSSLSDVEVKTLFEIIKKLKDKGITIIYISHKLDEVYKLCDRVTIMRDGNFINTFILSGLSKDILIQNMVGRDVEIFAKRQRPRRANYDEIVLKVDKISGSKGFKNISFNLYKGELLGFFGLVGAKRTETMLGIFGADPITSGKIFINGKEIKSNSPVLSIKEKLGLLPESRKEVGFIQEMNNSDNIAIASLEKFEKGLFQDHKSRLRNAVQTGGLVGLSPNNPEFLTKYLSGGNQQKVIIAKWLTTDADIIIFDEPTKGIDIGSKSDIYEIMEDLLEKGKSLIIVSSELPEVIGMSDRIVVMHEGTVSGILKHDEFDESTILKLAIGVNQ